MATSKHDTQPDLPPEEATSSAPAGLAASFPDEDGWDLDGDPGPATPPKPEPDSPPAAAPDPVSPPAAAPDPVSPPAAAPDPGSPPAAAPDPGSPPAAAPDPGSPPAAVSPPAAGTIPPSREVTRAIPASPRAAAANRALRPGGKGQTQPLHGRSPEPAGGSVSAELAAVSWKKPEVGDVLGSYRILQFIGGGGMALIYRAEHVRLKRQAALKVLRPALASQSEEVLRFFEEARAVNEIRHPNIVDIFDFIENTELHPPLVYMVMELLSGEDLHNFIRRHARIEPREAIVVADQIADALAAVHAQNIIHRDLKPNNIHVESDAGASPRVKILDFGLVKAFGRREGRALTSPEVLVGTPEYMAPEQVLGAPLDHRTDIYTLGLVIYEMLAGKRAFDGEPGEVLVKQAKDPPLPLPQTLPPTLVALVDRCLEKDPVDRFQSMVELRDALARADDEAQPVLEVIELAPKSAGEPPAESGATALDRDLDTLMSTGPQPALDLPAAAAEPLVVPRKRGWLVVAALAAVAATVVAVLVMRPRSPTQQAPKAIPRPATLAPDLGLDAGPAMASTPDARAETPDATAAPKRRRATKQRRTAKQRRPRRRRARRVRDKAIERGGRPPAPPAPPRSGSRRKVGEGTVDPFAR